MDIGSDMVNAKHYEKVLTTPDRI